MKGDAKENAIIQLNTLESQNQFFNEGEVPKTAIEIGEIFFAEASKYFETLPSVKISEAMLKDIYNHVFAEGVSFAELREYFKNLPSLEISKPLGVTAEIVFAIRECFLGAVYCFQRGEDLIPRDELEVIAKKVNPDPNNRKGFGSDIIELRPFEYEGRPIPEHLPQAVTNYALCLFRDGSRSEEIALEIFSRLVRLCPNDTSILGHYKDCLEINAVLLATQFNNIIGTIDHLKKAIKIDERIKEINDRPLLEG